MSDPIFLVDAFADKPFAGNPAAVVLLEKSRDEKWMQSLGSEMNQAETAFVMKRGDGFDLRWFTPTVEVDLCGHATLASAHVLWETGKLKPTEPARFHTRSGLLTCEKNGDWIEMDFPSLPAERVEKQPKLLDALGLSDAIVVKSKSFFLVEVATEQHVRKMVPDFAMLKQIPAVGIIVTARSSGEFDFISRFFAPQSGINEDHATGSAHCTLGPHWSEKLGKTELKAFQASPRGAVIRVGVKSDRVTLAGKAVTMLHGELRDAQAP
jgi:PhzF family phenazine biosynthesis protein